MTPPALRPLILAPAGSREAFLAALAAGADGIYCGLKAFSARMEARNFGLGELRDLVALARGEGARVFVTLNTLLASSELGPVGSVLERLGRFVRPDGVIVQDLALAPLLRQAGFQGEVHWSTLANVSFAAALSFLARRLPADAVVLPRELTIDEIRLAAAACPPRLGLEVFVQGALCYGVSGRCYWSSYLGGKSGLRGRCVQPCRRLYRQGRGAAARHFSCLDLELEVLAKVLLTLPQVRAWKIEGRKKGPHYVHATVSAYRLIRDHAGDRLAQREARGLLSLALGRPGTHFFFLPQRPQNPVPADGRTGSGLFLGVLKGPPGRLYFNPRIALLPGDLLRIGFEDTAGHRLERVGRTLPAGGRLVLPAGDGPAAARGTPVFLIDRREEGLRQAIAALEEKLPGESAPLPASDFRVRLPQAPGNLKPGKAREEIVSRTPRPAGRGKGGGAWLDDADLGLWEGVDPARFRPWLPPVLFPDEEAGLRGALEVLLDRGFRSFVLNAPWQVALFPPEGLGLSLWAGPFCNLANPLALEVAAGLGFSGAIVSPELPKAEALSLPRRSPLPLGIVIAGLWPLCVSRISPPALAPERAFRSPKGEEAWFVRRGGLTWVYPNWQLDLRAEREGLRRAGYCLFVELAEPVPPGVRLKSRPGRFNWDGSWP
ncbi:MAG: peptidase U32 family protein [Desulfobacterales bacterium]